MFDILMPCMVFLLLGELLLVACYFLSRLLAIGIEGLWREHKKKKGC